MLYLTFNGSAGGCIHVKVNVGSDKIRCCCDANSIFPSPNIQTCLPSSELIIIDFIIINNAQRSAAQRSAAQRSAAQRSAAQRSAAQRSAAQRSAAQRSAAQFQTADDSG